MPDDLAQSQFPPDSEWKALQREGNSFVTDIPQDLSTFDTPDIPSQDLQLDMPPNESTSH